MKFSLPQELIDNANKTDAVRDELIKQLSTAITKAHEDAAAGFLKEHGRWPKFTWDPKPLAEPELIIGPVEFTIKVIAGDFAPPGSVPFRWGILNQRQISE